MQKNSQSHFAHTLTTGFAMFSMFFGAGNVVFPLALGQHAQDQNFFAILGLLITAVGVPFLGLMAMTLYDGDYKAFFGRMGKIPGFLIALVIMGLIGPFGAIPRCIALSFSTTHLLIPNLSIELFSILSCVLIFLFTYKRSSILDILGSILTPFLLISLGLVIVKGLLTAGPLPVSEHSSFDTFMIGLTEGYQTMDLLGAFFFSSIVILGLKKGIDEDSVKSMKKIITLALKASCIGAFLLALIYVGFSYLAASNSAFLAALPADKMLGTLSIQVLGGFFGVSACIAVALACLTTAIALAAVSAEYIVEDLTDGKVGYLPGLIITLVISYFVSIMNFTGIVKFLAPILEVSYPALIALTICSSFKLVQFKPVKTPVFLVFLATVGAFLLHYFELWM